MSAPGTVAKLTHRSQPETKTGWGGGRGGGRIVALILHKRCKRNKLMFLVLFHYIEAQNITGKHPLVDVKGHFLAFTTHLVGSFIP